MWICYFTFLDIRSSLLFLPKQNKKKKKILFITFCYFYFANIRCKMLKAYINSLKICYIFFQTYIFITTGLLVYEKKLLFIYII